MDAPWFNPESFAFTSLGVIGPLLALIGFLAFHDGRFPKWVHVVVGGGAVVGAGVGLVALFSYQPFAIWFCPQLLLLEYVVYFFVPDVQAQASLLQVGGLLGIRRVRFVAMLGLFIACATLAVVVASLGVTDDNLLPPPEEVAQVATEYIRENFKDYEPVLPSPVSSDLGRTIAIAKRAADQAPCLNLQSLEVQGAILDNLGVKGSVIPVAQGWQPCNCHGWVFAGGAFWVNAADVDIILRENGYYPVVNSPLPNDLAIYRSANGEVSHSGIVRTATSGLILVESKWGKMGRFIHPHDVHGYVKDQCFFYRSSRQGHLLQGLSPPNGSDIPGSKVLEQYYPTLSRPTARKS